MTTEKLLEKSRADYMTQGQKTAMGKLPRTHKNCIEKTEKARPGKTAKDHATGAWIPKHARRQRAIDTMIASKERSRGAMKR